MKAAWVFVWELSVNYTLPFGVAAAAVHEFPKLQQLASSCVGIIITCTPYRAEWNWRVSLINVFHLHTFLLFIKKPISFPLWWEMLRGPLVIPISNITWILCILPSLWSSLFPSVCHFLCVLYVLFSLFPLLASWPTCKTLAPKALFYCFWTCPQINILFLPRKF